MTQQGIGLDPFESRPNKVLVGAMLGRDHPTYLSVNLVIGLLSFDLHIS